MFTKLLLSPTLWTVFLISYSAGRKSSTQHQHLFSKAFNFATSMFKSTDWRYSRQTYICVICQLSSEKVHNDLGRVHSSFTVLVYHVLTQIRMLSCVVSLRFCVWTMCYEYPSHMFYIRNNQLCIVSMHRASKFLECGSICSNMSADLPKSI